MLLTFWLQKTTKAHKIERFGFPHELSFSELLAFRKLHEKFTVCLSSQAQTNRPLIYIDSDLKEVTLWVTACAWISLAFFPSIVIIVRKNWCPTFEILWHGGFWFFFNFLLLIFCATFRWNLTYSLSVLWDNLWCSILTGFGSSWYGSEDQYCSWAQEFCSEMYWWSEW